MGDGSKGNRWYHPKTTALSVTQRGPFVQFPDGRYMTIGDNQVMVSYDRGQTWTETTPMVFDEDGAPSQGGPGIPAPRGHLLLTRAGTLVYVWMDDRVLNWDDETGEPGSDAHGDQWAIRSVDGGKTWEDRQRLYEGVCGHPPINIIETANGRIVVTAQYYLRQPGRNVLRVYSSGDEGRTWRGSNIIDLGGHGHHDGAFEPTFVQLRDGRLWMLIRTNWDRFWEAYSDDDGLSWRIIRPSQIESSTSPGYLTRLHSGRLALVWSRLYPEGADSFARRSGQFSEAEASWHREELSLAFSEDEGQTWSKPVVLVRERDTWLSYPFLYEPSPGELWLFSGQGDVRIAFQEDDFLNP